ncbi:MAG: hypothetical protein KR126chlam4_00975 [Candidatus Anoxychlamydiales bacterium]|nr:hypothetical protein [Candidatus Anoxychlamydiales bacterium]
MNKYFIHHCKLPDINQNWWELASIQLTGVTSLPILLASILIIQNSNIISGILTLLIGNIILWIIRYAIIIMGHDGRKSVLDVAYVYLGKFGTYFIAILLLVATLAWFVMQTTIATNALNTLFPIKEPEEINKFAQIGVFIGIICTLLCMNGMVLLRWLSVISFPIILIAFIAIIFTSNPTIPADVTSGISLAGLPIILGTNLGITADLPTFFRHSNSLKDSLYALTAIQLFTLVFGLAALFLGAAITPWLGTHQNISFTSPSLILKISLISLIFFSTICTNVANVYSASVGWELIAPILAGIKEYLILGLGLTIIFILIANIFSLNFFSVHDKI